MHAWKGCQASGGGATVATKAQTYTLEENLERKRPHFVSTPALRVTKARAICTATS